MIRIYVRSAQTCLLTWFRCCKRIENIFLGLVGAQLIDVSHLRNEKWVQWLSLVCRFRDLRLRPQVSMNTPDFKTKRIKECKKFQCNVFRLRGNDKSAVMCCEWNLPQIMQACDRGQRMASCVVWKPGERPTAGSARLWHRQSTIFLGGQSLRVAASTHFANDATTYIKGPENHPFVGHDTRRRCLCFRC